MFWNTVLWSWATCVIYFLLGSITNWRLFSITSCWEVSPIKLCTSCCEVSPIKLFTSCWEVSPMKLFTSCWEVSPIKLFTSCWEVSPIKLFTSCWEVSPIKDLEEVWFGFDDVGGGGGFDAWPDSLFVSIWLLSREYISHFVKPVLIRICKTCFDQCYCHRLPGLFE